eukprot:6577018-Prymnesium_polylepis.1
MPGINTPSYGSSYASYDDAPSYEDASYDDAPSYEDASYDATNTSYDDGEDSASTDAKGSSSGPLSALAGPLVIVKVRLVCLRSPSACAEPCSLPNTNDGVWFCEGCLALRHAGFGHVHYLRRGRTSEGFWP